MARQTKHKDLLMEDMEPSSRNPPNSQFSSMFSKSIGKMSVSKLSSHNFRVSHGEQLKEDDDGEDDDDSRFDERSSGSSYMTRGKRGRGGGASRGRGTPRPRSSRSKKSSMQDDDDLEQMDIPSFSQQQESSKSKKSSNRKKKSDIFMESQSDEENSFMNVFSDEDDDMSISSKKSKALKMHEDENQKCSDEDSDESVRLEKQEMMSGLQDDSNNNSKSKKSSIFRQDSDSDDDQNMIEASLSQYQKLKKQDTPRPQNQTKLQDLRQCDSNPNKSHMPGQDSILNQQIRKDLNEKNKKIKQYADGFIDYKQRRVNKYIDGKIDLNVRYLHQLVYDCYVQGLICEEIMFGIKFMGIGNSLEFVERYEEEKLSQFDFKKVKFTVFDHRRLSKLLLEKGTKNKYSNELPLYLMPYQLHSFTTKVYEMPEDTYDAFCFSIDEAYQLKWWKTIGTQLKGKQPKPQIVQQQPQPPKKKSNPSKRIRYKIKPSEESKKDNTGTEEKQKQAKVESEEEDDNEKIRLEEDCLMRDQDMEISHSNVDIGDSSLLEVSSKKSKPENKSSIYSSSIFETERVLDSSFSMDSNTHSLEDVSDLLHDFSISESKQKKEDKSKDKKKDKKKKKITKQVLQAKEMQKVQRGFANLKKIQQNIKNKSKAQKQELTKKEKIQDKKTQKQEEKKKNTRKVAEKKQKVQKSTSNKKSKRNLRSSDISQISEERIASSLNSDDI